MSKVLEHKHIIINAKVNNPPMCTKKMDEWMTNMVEAIGMKILDGPRSIYSNDEGNRGLTSSVILNTSNACVHTWDEFSPALFRLDVYTCGSLDVDVIFDLLTEFDPVEMEYLYIDREDEIRIINKGKLNADG